MGLGGFAPGTGTRRRDEWVLGTSDSPDAIVGYYDPDADQWTEGIADIESGEWIPVDAVRVSGGRDCPPGFPVKGNLPSRVFHSPGQANYDRTTPEVCFANEAAARGRRVPPVALGSGAAAAARCAAAPVAAAAAPRPSRMLARPRHRHRRDQPLRHHRSEPDRNWLWWILGALAIAALLWWFFFRPQQQPAVEVTPEATVAAPAATTPQRKRKPVGIVATPAKASPVAGRATPWARRVLPP